MAEREEGCRCAQERENALHFGQYVKTESLQLWCFIKNKHNCLPGAYSTFNIQNTSSPSPT